MERPTYGQVMEWLQERRGILNTMHTAMTRDEEWFDAGTSDAAKQRVRGQLRGLPRQYEAKMIPLAYLGVMVGVNQIHTGESIEARWSIPEGRYEEEERKARENKMNRWLRGLVYTMDTFSTDSALRELVVKLIALGMGCLSYAIAYDRWPEPPFGYIGRGKDRRPREPRPDRPKDREKYAKWQRERARSFPFNIECVHPLNLFFDPHHAMPYDFIREELVSKSALQDITPELGVTQPSGDDAKTVKRITYVSPEWIGQWVDEAPLLKGKDVIDGVAPNHTGLPLHRMAFGGFGTQVKSGDFASKGKGIIRDGRDLIVMKTVLLNTLERMRGVVAFPPLQVKGDDPAERAQVAGNITYGPGEILESPTTVQIQEFPEVKVPAVVFQQMDQVDALLETHFGPQILRGQSTPQETAQGQRNRFTIATSIYRAAQQAAQQVTAAVLMDLAYLVKYELREQCPVMYGMDATVVSVGPDDIDDGAMLVVDFTPPTQDEKAFKAENDRKDLEMGLITAQEYLERNGVANAEEMVRSVRIQKVVDGILGSEAVMMMATNQVVQSMGGAVPPQPGAMPPTPGAPEGGGFPPMAATPSGQTVQAQPGTIAGNPQQQLAATNMQETFAAPL